MSIANRIQSLRKTKGISQQELADAIQVSRQAVSKWESEQSMPDLNKIILMSDYFNVTTDFLLKGIEVVENKEQKKKEIVSKILYISSTALIVIGLLCAIGEWYEKQTMTSIYGSMIIQVVGIFEYFLAKILSKEKPSFLLNWLNIILVSFMPISMITGFLARSFVSPYPIGLIHGLIFIFIYGFVLIVSYIRLKSF